MATAASSVLCDPCKDSGDERDPLAFCLECKEFYCKICFNCHRKQKATSSHQYVKVSGDEPGKSCPCESCNDNKIASSLCTECRELYCTVCTNCHRKFKATKNHMVLEIVTEKSGSAALCSDIAALNFNATYSGAQVPVEKQGQQDGSSVDNENTGTSVLNPGNSKSDNVNQETTSLSATFHSEFSVHTPSDKDDADINRMIALPDGRICVVDRRDYKLKLFSDDYVLCDELRVFGQRDVTVIDNDTLAVSISRNDCENIICYSVRESKFTKTERKLHIDGKVYGIAYRRGEFIIRYDKDKTDYTCFGSKTIVKQNRKLDLSDFLHYNSVNDSVLLGNFVEHTVSCYTLNGDVQWRVSLNYGPKGIVVVHGMVLVAVHAAHAIRQITMDGRLLSDPLLAENRGITKPHAITYQPQQHRLLVAKCYRNDVMVFNLSQ